ncbi:MAG: class I SAM-dependent methyltransferase [Thermoanaerobaculia bacterium]
MSDPGRDSSSRLIPSELVDWPKRLAKEQPLIGRVLAEAPSKRVLDLGCGTGQHARFLADQGYEVVAIDASEAALERAQNEPVPAGVQFLLGDMGAVERSVRGHLGAALCLGNTLPHLLSPESLSRMLVGLKRRLLPGAPFLFQVLNYDRIFAGAERALPLELLPSPRGELIVVRLVQPREDGMVLHTTSALRYRPTADPVMEVVDTHATQLRGWKRAELETMLEVARLSTREVYGDMAAAPYDPLESLELVMVVG